MYSINEVGDGSALPPMQAKVFGWIQDWIETQRIDLPPQAEIARELGLKSHRSIQKHIEALVKKGFLAPARKLKAIWLEERPRRPVGRPPAKKRRVAYSVLTASQLMKGYYWDESGVLRMADGTEVPLVIAPK